MKKIVLLLFIMILGSSLMAIERVQQGQYVWSSSITTPSSTEAVLTFENGRFLEDHVIQYVVAGISTNLVFTMDGSLDGTNWFNMDTDELTTTINANGTYSLTRSNCPIKQIRLTQVSETGGTTATINARYMGN